MKKRQIFGRFKSLGSSFKAFFYFYYIRGRLQLIEDSVNYLSGTEDSGRLRLTN
jgi:hypothetical protein